MPVFLPLGLACNGMLTASNALKVFLFAVVACGSWRMFLQTRILEYLLKGPALPLGQGWNRVRTASILKQWPGCSKVPPAAGVPRTLRVVTWNLLAPCYHRMNGALEAKHQKHWWNRLEDQLQLLEEMKADIVLLQEWWHGSTTYQERWFQWAASKHMSLFATPRTSNKPDGLAVLLSAELTATNIELSEFSFNDWGDRVVQLLRFEALGFRWLVANTHLTYPHPNSYDPPMRWHQGRKLGDLLGVELHDRLLVVGGDFNGNRLDPAVQNVAKATGGVIHCAEEATHRDHRGNTISCDLFLTDGLSKVDQRLGGFDGCLGKDAHFSSDHRPLLVTLLPESASENSETNTM